MTSSGHDPSDNSEAEKQKEHHSSAATGLPHPGITVPNMQYATNPQLGAGPPMVPPAYAYPDPYYRSIFVRYDTQSYPPPQQPYNPHLMVQLHSMGIQQAGVPLPSDAVEEPVFVNAKQYHGIMRRRQIRAKAEMENKSVKSRKPYLHESRHLHALRRARGCGGRFVNSKKSDGKQKGGEKSQQKINLNNADKTDISASAGMS